MYNNCTVHTRPDRVIIGTGETFLCSDLRVINSSLDLVTEYDQFIGNQSLAEWANPVLVVTFTFCHRCYPQLCKNSGHSD